MYAALAIIAILLALPEGLRNWIDLIDQLSEHN
jgi:hypothetical protein